VASRAPGDRARRRGPRCGVQDSETRPEQAGTATRAKSNGLAERMGGDDHVVEMQQLTKLVLDSSLGWEVDV
jgi:hypothetical protein